MVDKSGARRLGSPRRVLACRSARRIGGASAGVLATGAAMIAYVEIAPGVRAMTNIVDCDPDTLAIGQSVEAVFRPSRSGQPILLFRPART